MANPNQQNDPLERIIADGRLTIRPTNHYGLPEIITVDLELMANTLVARLNDIYLNENRLRNYYVGNQARVYQAITGDIVSMVDYLVGQVYNKLRTILERRAPAARVARMNTRCPVASHQEFPAWLSSTLGAIGPCRLEDAPHDRLIVYASSAATMQTYGRQNPVVFNEGHYARLISALRAIGVTMAPFNHAGLEGSYYPTITPDLAQYVWTLYGQVHRPHYENEVSARIALVTSNIGQTPFENVGVTIGYVDDNNTLNALAAVAAPADLPAGQNADSAGRPVGAAFRVNYYGIQPAVAAQGEIPARARGAYILGRGVERYYSCVIANNVATSEILEVLRHRLLR